MEGLKPVASPDPERGVSIGVLASGAGTNLKALLDADLSPGRVARVVVNNPDAGAIAHAEASGVPVTVVDHRQHRARRAFDAEVVDVLRAEGVEWVVFAGFMRIVTSTLLDAFPGRVLNIHPSLLPAFPGTDAQRQALEAGVRITGCTVHLVDSGVDTGPILAQIAVPVLDDDDVERLRRRILEAEHTLLPRVVRALARGRIDTSGPRPRLLGLDADLSRSATAASEAAMR